MAKSVLVWDGLAELRAEILKLPEELTGEGQKLVEGAANGAFTDIVRAYPSRTGNLRKGMRIEPLKVKGQFVAGAVVKNIAKIAVIFERGTQARHYFTVNGVKKFVGKMPPGKVFVPRVVKARKAVTQALKDMVARHGAIVTGD